MTEPQDLPAGPELDRLMAETFLDRGDWYVSSPRSDNVIVHNGEPWLPSCDIGDAWDVLERLPAARDGCDRWYWKMTRTPLNYQIQLWRADGDKWNQPSGGPCVAVTAETAPLAICLAALKAVAVPLP